MFRLLLSLEIMTLAYLVPCARTVLMWEAGCTTRCR